MKQRFKLLLTSFGFTLAINGIAFAGTWEQDSSGWRYQNDDGSYVKDTQIWLDGDHDEIYQKFDFDSEGYCYMNETGHGNEEYNENGEWIYHGTVQTKRCSNTKYENWLDILKQSDSLMWQPFQAVQSTYGNPVSLYQDEMFWKTSTYSMEHSPFAYRFQTDAKTGLLVCDLIYSEDDFVPEGVTLRDLKNALGVDIYCTYTSSYYNGNFVSESCSYFFNYGDHHCTFQVQNGTESLDIPLKFTGIDIFPFNADVNVGVLYDNKDILFGSYMRVTPLV